MADSWEFDKKFALAVQKQPLLYDQSRKDFKDAQAKHAAWRSIGKNLGLTVEECKVNWKKIRDKYVKIMKALPSGTNAEEAENITWEVFPFLHFLKPWVKRRKSKSNTVSMKCLLVEVEEGISSKSSKEVYSLELDNQQSFSQQMDNQLVRKDQHDAAGCIKHEREASFANSENEASCASPEHDVADFTNHEVLENIQRSIALSSNKKRKAPDEFEVKQPTTTLPSANQQFLNSLLPYLDELAPEKCSSAKIKILTLLHDMRYK